LADSGALLFAQDKCSIGTAIALREGGSNRRPCQR